MEECREEFDMWAFCTVDEIRCDECVNDENGYGIAQNESWKGTRVDVFGRDD